MNDNNFDDPKVAWDWIKIIENDRSQLRQSDIYPRLKYWSEQSQAKETLEIGCGQGACSTYINQTYTGVEPSPILVDRARELYPTLNFVLGDAYLLPFPEKSFDAVFSVAVWHLLSDLKKAACELSRVLKPHGHFLIISANPAAYELWTQGYESSKIDGRRFVGDSNGLQDVLYLHSLDEICGSLLNSQLKINIIETFRSSKNSNHFFTSIAGQSTSC